MVQGRYFGTDPTQPRYLTRGKRQSFHVFQRNASDVLVYVEDFVSGIKLGRFYGAYPIMGSHLPLETLLRASRAFSEHVVWLDFDKVRKAVQIVENALTLGLKARAVVADKDPKEYNDLEIQKFISKNRELFEPEVV